MRADDDDDARDEAILKPALAEGVDFEIVRERAMVKLEGWYGHVEGSRSIYRTCVRRGSGIYVDVYGLGLVAKFGDEERALLWSKGITRGHARERCPRHCAAGFLASVKALESGRAPEVPSPPPGGLTATAACPASVLSLLEAVG